MFRAFIPCSTNAHFLDIRMPFDQMIRKKTKHRYWRSRDMCIRNAFELWHCVLCSPLSLLCIFSTNIRTFMGANLGLNIWFTVHASVWVGGKFSFASSMFMFMLLGFILNMICYNPSLLSELVWSWFLDQVSDDISQHLMLWRAQLLSFVNSKNTENNFLSSNFRFFFFSSIIIFDLAVRAHYVKKSIIFPWSRSFDLAQKGYSCH